MTPSNFFAKSQTGTAQIASRKVETRDMGIPEWKARQACVAKVYFWVELRRFDKSSKFACGLSVDRSKNSPDRIGRAELHHRCRVLFAAGASGLVSAAVWIVLAGTPVVMCFGMRATMDFRARSNSAGGNDGNISLKFVQDLKAVPASFAQESFFANNAFRFVNSKGVKQAGRYQIVPVAGSQYLDEAAAKSKSPDFLREDLKARLAAGPVKFRLILQLAGAQDRTDDASVVWPDDRKIELGTITISSIVADSDAAEKALAFDPIRLTDGIELSDDPLPILRSGVYAISAAPRRRK